MNQAEQESRLSRWSRRKQQTAEDTQKEDLLLELKEQELPENEIQEALSEDQRQIETEEPVLSDADMEPIESLTDNSDFSKFMSPGVSDELRNLALRKMFQAPFFNIRDGLDEYDEDYTTFEKLGDIVTCDMRHQMEVEANKKLEMEAKALSESESIASESIGDEEDIEPVEDQTRSIAAEDESLEESDGELAVDNLAGEELAGEKLAIDNKEISSKTAETVQQN